MLENQEAGEFSQSTPKDGNKGMVARGIDL